AMVSVPLLPGKTMFAGWEFGIFFLRCSPQCGQIVSDRLGRGVRNCAWGRQASNEAEMVARPHAPDRFVEDARAGRDLESGSSVITRAHENIIDPSEGPVPISHERMARREGVAWIAGMRALPSISVTDAHAAQGLTARPEAHARCGGLGIQ